MGVQGDEAVGERDMHEQKLGTSSSEAILSLHGRVWMTIVVHQARIYMAVWRASGQCDGTEDTISYKSCEESAGS